jgi:cytochrome P450
MSNHLAGTKFPPGPKGWPIVGCLPHLRRDPIGFLSGLARDYGDIVHFKILGKHVFQLYHPDLVREFFVTQHPKLRKTGIMKQAEPILGNGIFLSEGETHLRQRRLIQPIFSRQKVAGFAKDIAEIAADVRASWTDAREINVSSEMLRLSLRVVAKTLFDINLDSSEHEIEESLTTILGHFNTLLVPRPKILSKLPTARNRRFNQARAQLESMVYRIMNESRSRDRDQRHVVSLLLSARDEEGDKGEMTQQQVRDEVMTLLVAGHETVATTLSWTWYCLSQNPEVESQFYAEIDEVLADRLPTAEDLEHLPYTEMVIAESMRLFPPVWALSRRTAEDLSIAGYEIPIGSMLGVSQYVTHRDPRFFPEPERFDPTRWTAEAKAARPRYAYFPFGGGPRLCIGEPMAWMETKIVLATIAQQWHLSYTRREAPRLQARITLRPQDGLSMRIDRRTSVDMPLLTAGAAP